LQQRVLEKLSTRQPSSAIQPGIQEAGVALILGSAPDAILAIRRAERRDDPWSGHMGLPGGRRERVDPDLVATAIRETQEEVGIAVDRSALLGRLDDVTPRSQLPPTILARPYVFGVSGHPQTILNQEVSAAFWIPLDRLRDPALFREAVLNIGGSQRSFPAYHIEEGLIWGMTERVLTLFFEIVSDV
jgi:8-oxo-dGTP pyrophosphatase MutT (NUDIX family)